MEMRLTGSLTRSLTGSLVGRFFNWLFQKKPATVPLLSISKEHFDSMAEGEWYSVGCAYQKVGDRQILERLFIQRFGTEKEGQNEKNKV